MLMNRRRQRKKERKKKKEREKERKKEHVRKNASANATYPVVFDLAKFALVYFYNDRISIFVQTTKRCGMGDDDGGTDFP